jgi:hypothetical protein
MGNDSIGSQKHPTGEIAALTRYAVDPLRAGLAGSNAQHEQRHEADSGEQRRECHGIVFEPMPIRKHDVHPLFERHLSFS